MKAKNVKTGDILLIPKGTPIFSKLLDSQALAPEDTIAVIDMTSNSGETSFINPKYVKYNLPEPGYKFMDMGFDRWSVLTKHLQPYENPQEPSNYSLRKLIVCAECKTVGVSDEHCICQYANEYPTLELEFYACKCCGSPVDPLNCVDNEYNKITICEFEAH